MVFSDIDTVLDCMEAKLNTSTRQSDVMFQQMYSFDNVRAIVQYACKIAPGKRICLLDDIVI